MEVELCGPAGDRLADAERERWLIRQALDIAGVQHQHVAAMMRANGMGYWAECLLQIAREMADLRARKFTPIEERPVEGGERPC